MYMQWYCNHVANKENAVKSAPVKNPDNSVTPNGPKCGQNPNQDPNYWHNISEALRLSCVTLTMTTRGDNNFQDESKDASVHTQQDTSGNVNDTVIKQLDDAGMSLGESGKKHTQKQTTVQFNETAWGSLLTAEQKDWEKKIRRLKLSLIFFLT
ncbi:predicted protein [Postia placenta Mad-698-R]|nr:predicted protein [Postia placenta Mad-698-R]